MRKSALLLAVLMVAAAPATALAAKKKAAAKPADPNANAKKFVAAAWQQPVYIWQGMWSPWWAKKKS